MPAWHKSQRKAETGTLPRSLTKADKS